MILFNTFHDYPLIISYWNICSIIYHHMTFLSYISWLSITMPFNWWFGTFFHMLGMSSSQLTTSYFSEGWLNHRPGIVVNIYIYIFIAYDYPQLYSMTPLLSHHCDVSKKYHYSMMSQWSTSFQPGVGTPDSSTLARCLNRRHRCIASVVISDGVQSL